VNLTGIYMPHLRAETLSDDMELSVIDDSVHIYSTVPYRLVPRKH
jgi:hypothetical protein